MIPDPILPHSIAKLLDQYEHWRKGDTVELMDIEDLETLCLYFAQKKHTHLSKVQEILEWSETYYPCSSIWHLIRATLFLTHKKKEKIATEKAIEAIWKAVQLEPDNIDAWLHLCELYIKEGKSIAPLIKEHIAPAVNDEDFIFIIEEVVCILESYGSYASALHYYLALIAHPTTHPQNILKAVFCAYLAHNLPLLKKKLLTLTRQIPNSSTIYLALALIYHLEGAIATAHSTYTYALSIAPTPQNARNIWHPLLQHITRSEAYQEGINFIDTVKGFCVFHPLPQQQFLLKAYTHLNDPPNILRSSKAVLKIAPLNKNALKAYATICWKTKQWKDALTLLRKSDTLCSSTQPDIHYLLGETYRLSGKPTQALYYYQSYLSYYPQKWRVWSLYLEILIANGQYEKVIEKATDAYQWTQHKEAWIFLSVAYKKMRHSTLAQTFLRNACEGEKPRHPCQRLYQKLLTYG